MDYIKEGCIRQSNNENKKFKLFEWVKTKDINNDEATFKELNQKLLEECTEVTEAIHNLSNEFKQKNVNDLAGELLDNIQVSISLLRRLRLESDKQGFKFNQKQIIDEHNFKVIERGWTVGRVYNIEIED